MHEDLFPTFRDEVPKSRVAETCQGLSLLLGKRIVTDQTVDLRFPVSGYEAMITKHTTNHSVADSDVVLDLGWVMRQEGLRYLLFVTTPAFAQQGHEHNQLVNVGHFQLVLYENRRVPRNGQSGSASTFLLGYKSEPSGIPCFRALHYQLHPILMVLEQIGRDWMRPRVTTMAAPPEPGEPGMGF